jgi:YVTN family beta-propeller protein
VTVINGSTNAATTISDSYVPRGIVANPITNKIYVANWNNDAVMVIDGSDNSTSSISVGTNPSGIALNPVTNKIYVANWWGNSLSVIDGETSAVTATVTVGGQPRLLAVNPVTNRIYVTNWSDNTLSAIDGATNSPVATVPVVTNPYQVVVNPMTNKVYVVGSNGGTYTVTVIDGETNTPSSLNVGAYPNEIAVNPGTNRIHIAGGCGYASIIDGATSTVIQPLFSACPSGVGVNPATNKSYYTNGTDIKVMEDSPVAVVPMTATVSGDTASSNYISGLQIYGASGGSVSFTATVTSSFSTTVLPPTGLYYQVDTTQGSWQAATATSSTGANPATYIFSLSGMQQGVHMLYAYAAYGNQGTGSDPQISNLTAIPFVVKLGSSTITLTTSSNPQDLGSPVTFTASVVPANGAVLPAGVVTFYDGATELGQATLEESGERCMRP